MFAITADQKSSRRDVDRAGDARDDLDARYADRLALPVDRTAGDEIQALVADASVALDIVLRLTRTGHWSVGLGVGSVRTPLPRATREAAGPAFVAARRAVTDAKRSPTRFALAVEPHPGQAAEEAEALITLLLLTRDRRTPAGWEVVDRMADGGTQRDVAAGLGITPQAVSTRLRTGGWRAERAAVPGLASLLARLDAEAEADATGAAS